MLTKRTTWEALKRKRMDHPEAQAGYDRARRAAEVGLQVRERRLALGWTQKELAQRARTTQVTIARIEGGGVMPTIDSLDHIAEALGETLLVQFASQQTPAGFA